MQIKNLSDSEFGQAGELVPQYILQKAVCVLVCESEGQLAGVAVLTRVDKILFLSWLYIEESMRGKGYGNALLDAAIIEAGKSNALCIEAAVDANSSGGRIIAAMLGRRNFILDFESMARIRVTKEQIAKAIFFTDSKLESQLNRFSASICPLRKLTKRQISNFIEKSEKSKNYLASKADYRGADKDKSMVLMTGDRITGVLLADVIEDGVFSVQLGCVEKNHNLEFLGLIKTAIDNLLKTEKNLKWLEFSCVDDTIVQFAKHIFPDCHVSRDSIVSGRCWL